MLAFLNQGWVSLLVAVFLSIVTFYAARRRAAPKAVIETSHELTWATSHQLPPGFELKFHGQPIPRISRGILRFWNGGSGTLSGDLIPQQGRLCLKLTDGKFLSTGIPLCSNSVNKFEASVDPNDPQTLHFSFDFLDPGEGAVVAFLHTSTVSTPTLQGSIKGHRINTLDNSASGKINPLIKRFKRQLFWTIPYSLITVGAVLFAVATLTDDFRLINVRKFLKFNDVPIPAAQIAPPPRTPLLLGGISYLLIGGGILWVRRRKYPKSLQWPTAHIGDSKEKFRQDN